MESFSGKEQVVGELFGGVDDTLDGLQLVTETFANDPS